MATEARVEMGPNGEHEPLRFERRCNNRWDMTGRATAFRLGGTSFGAIHELELADYSDGGLGAISPDVIEPGTLVSIGFDQPSLMARRGVVLRCVPCGDGYRIAVAFEGRLAA